jgi:lipid-A-disaccharide synthase
MKSAGVEVLYDIADLALVGLVEVWRKIFAIKEVFFRVLRETDSRRPQLAILVDYPGFNLRLAKELKKRDIPVVYYISPQVWAWGEDRINIIKGAVAKMLVFFKFEEELYKKHGVRVEFVGHPSVDVAKASLTREEVINKYGMDPARKIIALLPGSRKMEVARILPVMLDAAALLAKKIPGVQFIVSRFPGLDENLYKHFIARRGLDLRIVGGDTYSILRGADFAIVASGTAILETALIGTPMVLAYKVNLVNYIAFKVVAKVKNIGLVNIMAGKEVVPEFLQYAATGPKIADKVFEIMSAPNKLFEMKEEFAAIRESLGPGGSYSHAAHTILSEA